MGELSGLSPSPCGDEGGCGIEGGNTEGNVNGTSGTHTVDRSGTGDNDKTSFFGGVLMGVVHVRLSLESIKSRTFRGLSGCARTTLGPTKIKVRGAVNTLPRVAVVRGTAPSLNG